MSTKIKNGTKKVFSAIGRNFKKSWEWSEKHIVLQCLIFSFLLNETMLISHYVI